MSYILNNSTPLSEITTATGHIVAVSLLYNTSQKNGVGVLVAAAGISLLSVLVLLVVLAISAYKTLLTPNEHRFMRTHVVAYFISLLLCDFLSAVGSLMNGRWISQGGVFLGAFCTSQGALKNTGNVGTALWTMVIAIHTFCLLVLKWRLRDYTLYVTLFVVWSFIGLVVIIGPVVIQNMGTKGPYFGISGYWCWITDGYSAQRITLEYFWMFLSALISFLLYTVTFFSLRGNLIVNDGKLRLRFKRSALVWEAPTDRDSPDGLVMSLAKQMLVYPIGYTALILPIAICRFLEWAGHDIPFKVTIFADTVFLLSGLVNVTLFTATRKIVPTRQARGLLTRNKSSRSDIESQRSITPLVVPFVVTEKVSVPPFKTVPQVPVVPVPLPVPAVQGSYDNERSVSLTPTVSSLYSQKSVREPPSSTSQPSSQSKPLRTVAPQSTITPLSVVRTPLRRKTPTDVPVGVTEGPEVNVNQSYSSMNPMGPSHILPRIPPSTQPSHSKSASSSSTLSYRSQGNRF